MQTFILIFNNSLYDMWWEIIFSSFLKKFFFRERESQIFRHVSTKFLSRTEQKSEFLHLANIEGKSIFHERFPFTHKPECCANPSAHCHPSTFIASSRKAFSLCLYFHSSFLCMENFWAWGWWQFERKRDHWKIRKLFSQKKLFQPSV